MKSKQALFSKQLIKVFSEKTDCSVQFGDCPCNTCFHSIANVDFQHVVWLILLGLRGDYDKDEIINLIKEEVK
jgi:hypothetical protein